MLEKNCSENVQHVCDFIAYLVLFYKHKMLYEDFKNSLSESAQTSLRAQSYSIEILFNHVSVTFRFRLNTNDDLSGGILYGRETVLMRSSMHRQTQLTHYCYNKQLTKFHNRCTAVTGGVLVKQVSFSSCQTTVTDLSTLCRLTTKYNKILLNF